MNAMHRIAGLVSLVLAIAGPVTARDIPTGDALFAKALSKRKQVVEFTSALAPEEIERRMLDLPCGREKVRTSGIAPVGTLFIPVSTSVQFAVEHGVYSVDRSRWLVLRVDGIIHSAASGVQLVPRADGGSVVRVVKADKRKLQLIRASVEAGRLFCDWRDFDYPWD